MLKRLSTITILGMALNFNACILEEDKEGGGSD